jgi:hypothetical protein
MADTVSHELLRTLIREEVSRPLADITEHLQRIDNRLLAQNQHLAAMHQELSNLYNDHVDSVARGKTIEGRLDRLEQRIYDLELKTK